MPVMEFRTDTRGAMTALRLAPKDIRDGLRKELMAIGWESVKEARTKMPSGMRKGASGFTVRYWTTKGVIMQALGTDKVQSPKSYAAAVEGGPSGDKGWRHPVYDSRKPAKRWGPKNGTQAALHPLHDAWAARSLMAVGRADEAVRVALVKSGLSE